MAEHLRTKILQAFVDSLLGLPVTADRIRVDPTADAQPEDIPGLTLRSGNETLAGDVDEQDCTQADRLWAVGLEIRQNESETNVYRADVNDILLLVTPRLFADQTLGGLVTAVNLGPITFQHAGEGEWQHTLLTVGLIVAYSYDLSDPSVTT